MRTVEILAVFVTILSVSISSLSAQEVSWRLVLISGDTLIAGKLDSLPDRILYASGCNKTVSAAIDSIATIEHVTQTHSVRGIATLIGIAAGVAIFELGSERGPGSEYTAPFGAVVGALGGYLIGDIITESSGGHRSYHLSWAKTLEMKRQIVLRCLRDM